MDLEVEKLISLDSLLWATAKKLQVRPGVRFSMRGMPYLNDLVSVGKRICNIKKGTQLCLTTTGFVDCLHALYYRKYDQNILYMMPSVKSVQNMCAISFDPLINGNPQIFKKTLVSKNTSDAKTINGRTMSFAGAQPTSVDGSAKDSANLRSIPCDRVDRDEVDLMDPDMIEMSKQRLQRSKFRIERNWGSPTVPHWGIDLMYDRSDQRKWQIKCQACGKHTCLGETFPDCIKKVGDIWTRVCVYCGKEISVQDGFWRPDYPDRREAGFWVSGLLSPFCDLEDAMYRYENNEKNAEFMRSILGIATTDADCQLTRQAIQECCCNDGMRMSSTEKTVMGVDIGKKLHAVVGVRTGKNQHRVYAVKECVTYDELHDFAKKMNVTCTVMDSGPYDHGAREYQKSHSNVWLCYYSESQPGSPRWDHKQKSVKVNRNEWCDHVYENFMETRMVIPRETPTMTEYMRQLTCTEKTEVTNDAGATRPRWMKRGDDHYFHSTLYFLLAASRVSPSRTDGRRRMLPMMQENNYKI